MKEQIDLAQEVLDESADQFIGDLIKDFGCANPTVEVVVNGKVMIFHALVDRAKFSGLKRRAKRFITQKAAPTEEQTAWLDTDDETKIWSFILAEMSLTPKFTRMHFLHLAKTAFIGFEMIKDGYLAKLAGVQNNYESAELDVRGEE